MGNIMTPNEIKLLALESYQQGQKDCVTTLNEVIVAVDKKIEELRVVVRNENNGVKND